MTNFARLMTATAVAASTLAAAPAFAAPVGATTPAVAKAQIVKPLTLAKKQDLDFGTIVLPTSANVATTVSIDSAGLVTCGTGMTCSGSPKAAIFTITGTNNQVVKVYSALSKLTNANDSTKQIDFTPAPPATVSLSNSGNTGLDFNVGGKIDLPAAVTDGVYSGSINVTVDYN